ncbi:MAG: hypothetical protein AB7O45_16050 [Alphaproteobacteria bacterium]
MTRPTLYLRLDALRRRRLVLAIARISRSTTRTTIVAATNTAATAAAIRPQLQPSLPIWSDGAMPATLAPLRRNRSLVVAGPVRTIRKLPRPVGSISAATARRIAAVQMANLSPAARTEADPTMRLLGGAVAMTALAFLLLGGAL